MTEIPACLAQVGPWVPYIMTVEDLWCIRGTQESSHYYLYGPNYLWPPSVGPWSQYRGLWYLEYRATAKGDWTPFIDADPEVVAARYIAYLLTGDAHD